MSGQKATLGKSHMPCRVGGGPGGGLVPFWPRRVLIGPNLTKALTLGAEAGWGIPTPGYNTLGVIA
jgi:hypothetical protein